MSQFEKFCTAIIMVVVLILGAVVMKWGWLDSSNTVPTQQTTSIDIELGPNETLILGASIITVGIVAGLAERLIFGDKESRKNDAPGIAVPDES